MVVFQTDKKFSVVRSLFMIHSKSDVQTFAVRPGEDVQYFNVLWLRFRAR